ncbi:MULTISPECIES: hypothetical protein [unclassified Neorhizobium]|uniref:hypothetical protein n=1 Tax=unclassified Neorhizobium TaxID=2629175 RepID=UPI001FF4F6FF|nr:MULTISPECIES: hypothetical protein [unclassified Neorhizobium]MCJ9669448.1 hypothetical protein [Neorhizobium sp. SHOUNA12B]MCJ9745527.1 hypothetical protein [Neorhizobium sp. SHOUNA12A]
MVSKPLSSQCGVRQMKDQTVILVRRFFPAAPQRGDWEFLSPVAGGTAQHWRAFENLYRVLILAEPGAGKTFEARDQARKLAEKGKKAFFIRIEKLDSTFDTAFEIGTAEAFESWQSSPLVCAMGCLRPWSGNPGSASRA